MAKKKSTSDGDKSEVTGIATAPASPYVVLARKYRPQTFDDLIGQQSMVTTLRNAFATGRIAQGYMLTGVRGVGKTTTARILARALNYETDGVDTPTIDMPSLRRHCVEIMESRHPDVIEMDAASNTSVDNVREIIESARYKPILARTKVFIIDEVHMLSKGAFNALLKTLEEPPAHVKFIFATTEIRKVPVTVLSRCQRFDLRRVEVAELVEHFGRIVGKEGATADDDALVMIARATEGSVRDGLSILDQAIATGQGRVTAAGVRTMLGLADRGRVFDLLDQVLSGDCAAAITSLLALHHDGADTVQLIGDLAEAVHLATRIKVIGAGAGAEGLSGEEKRRATALAERLSVPLLSRAWQMLVKGLDDIARAPDALAAAEMVVIRIAYTADLPPPDDLIKAIGGQPVPARRASTYTAPAATDRAPAPTAQSAEAGHREFAPNTDDAPFEDVAPETQPEDDAAAPASAPAPAQRTLRTFEDVARLAGERRDAKLRVHLEEHVSLVKFDGAANSIDLFLLPGAPPEFANDLREKLNRWTGRRWVIVLSKAPGDQPLGEVTREREAREIASLKEHPAVAAVFEQFPDARIVSVKPIPAGDKDEAGTG